MKDLDSKKIFEAYNKKRKETLIKESDKPILIPPRKGFDPSGKQPRHDSSIERRRLVEMYQSLCQLRDDAYYAST